MKKLDRSRLSVGEKIINRILMYNRGDLTDKIRTILKRRAAWTMYKTNEWFQIYQIDQEGKIQKMHPLKDRSELLGIVEKDLPHIQFTTSKDIIDSETRKKYNCLGYLGLAAVISMIPIAIYSLESENLLSALSIPILSLGGYELMSARVTQVGGQQLLEAKDKFHEKHPHYRGLIKVEVKE